MLKSVETVRRPRALTRWKMNASSMWKLLTIILSSLIAFGLIAAGYAWYIFWGLTDKERARLQQRK
jgi:hypothetical protein